MTRITSVLVLLLLTACSARGDSVAEHDLPYVYTADISEPVHASSNGDVSEGTARDEISHNAELNGDVTITSALSCAARYGNLTVGANYIMSCNFPVRAQTVCATRTNYAGTYQFVAPNAGNYVLSTTEVLQEDPYMGMPMLSTASILRIQDPTTCQVIGGSAGCYVGDEYTAPSIKVALQKGQRIFVTVASHILPCNALDLSITEYKATGCKPSVLAGSPALRLGANDLGYSCSAPLDPTFSMCTNQYRLMRPNPRYFTAPSNGTYIFESDVYLPSALSVRTEVGTSCRILGCNSGSGGSPPRVIVKLLKGQRVSVILGATVEYCDGVSLLISKAVRECRVDSNCPSVRPGAQPRFGYKCISQA